MRGRHELPQIFPGGRNEQAVFRREAARIVAGWRSRRSNRLTRPPWDTAHAYLKRETYRLIRHYLSARCSGAVEALVERYGRVPANGPTMMENPFHWGLLAIAPSNGEFIGRADRRLFAAQLLHAHLHDVPEEYLIGFIAQIGSNAGPTIFERVARRRRERLFVADTPRTT